MQKYFIMAIFFVNKKMIAVITRRKIFSIRFESCFIIFTLVGSDSL